MPLHALRFAEVVAYCGAGGGRAYGALLTSGYLVGTPRFVGPNASGVPF